MLTVLVGCLCASVFLVWVSTFGYWSLLLLSVGRSRKRAGQRVSELPEITVIVPVLNEERFIRDKLSDLQDTECSHGRLRIVVVDGGSSDSTIEFVNEFSAYRWPVHLMHVRRGRGKATQVSVALRHVDTDYVVLTDADTTLEPRCIGTLVSALVEDPSMAIAGALVKPVTRLAEERFHWRLINKLWYLEGRVFGAAGASGVCHALRTCSLDDQIRLRHSAEDMELTVNANRAGWRSCIIPDAVAYEHRVPETFAEMLLFRTRRADGYKRLLFDAVSFRSGNAPGGLVNWIRRWQLVVNPVLLVVIVVSAMALLILDRWGYTVAVALLFAGSFLAWLWTVTGTLPRLSQIRVLFRWFLVAVASVFSVWSLRAAVDIRGQAKQAFNPRG